MATDDWGVAAGGGKYLGSLAIPKDCRAGLSAVTQRHSAIQRAQRLRNVTAV